MYIDYSDNERIYILERILIGILIQVKIEDYLIYTKVLREITEVQIIFNINLLYMLLKPSII